MSALRDWFRRRPASTDLNSSSPSGSGGSASARPAYEQHPWQQPFGHDPQWAAHAHGPAYPFWPAPTQPPPPHPHPPLQRLNTQEMEANQVGFASPASGCLCEEAAANEQCDAVQDMLG